MCKKTKEYLNGGHFGIRCMVIANVIKKILPGPLDVICIIKHRSNIKGRSCQVISKRIQIKLLVISYRDTFWRWSFLL